MSAPVDPAVERRARWLQWLAPWRRGAWFIRLCAVLAAPSLTLGFVVGLLAEGG